MMLKNKNIVVIGGTTGMGLSAVHAFIRAGAAVVALGYEETETDTASMKGKKIVLTADARQEHSAQQAIHTCLESFGSFDGLFHVAGGSGRRFGDGPLHELSLDGWNKTMELNLTSVMLSNQAAVKAFLQQKKGGSILNMGSVLATSPSPVHFSTHAYATAKAAINGFSRSIAAYYAQDNIRVNVLAPGLVQTPMAVRAAGNEMIMDFIKSKQPLDGGRIGHPQDLDGAACYFMSDYSAFTTGQILCVDGGWSLCEGQYP